MLTPAQILEQARLQLSCDFGCTPQALQAGQNVFVRSALCPGRRRFFDRAPFFHMVTMGGNAVLAADDAVLEPLRQYAEGLSGPSLFEYGNLRALEQLLQPYGKSLDRTYHIHLPLAAPADAPLAPTLTLRWYEQAQLAPLYAAGLFRNALHEQFVPECPDMLAVAALQGDRIVGVAGCAADSPLFWQIGIDVLPAARGCGVGTALVTLLRQAVLERGCIPYYATSQANLFSRRIAQRCGFVPAWVEAETLEP